MMVSDVRLSAALTETTVQVNSGFTGAEIVLYGAVFQPDETPLDVVVLVRGPERSVRLVRKHERMGVWVNSRPVVFRGAPGYYMSASSRPLPKIANFSVRRRWGLGVENLPIDAPAEKRVETTYGVKNVVVSALGEDYLLWRNAVVRLKQAAGLYNSDPKGVRFVDQGLFRAEVVLPSSAPIGRYEAKVLLFRNGEAIAERNQSLIVEKVGFERMIYNFARTHSLVYGLICVALALGAGWAAAALFRRA